MKQGKTLESSAKRTHWSQQTTFSDNTREDSTHGHHQMVNTEIRLITFFAAKDGEAVYSQQKQDEELTEAQIMDSLLPNSDLNSRKQGKITSELRYDLNQISYDYTVEVRNRFKVLDLIDRVPDELWTEVRDIVQETGIKTIPMEKKCKKAKWLSGEALQIAVKRREAKSKGEKERYTHLNAEFQRIARGDKKAFLSDHCKEIEENNRMGKIGDLFKKIRDTKGIFQRCSVQRWAR